MAKTGISTRQILVACAAIFAVGTCSAQARDAARLGKDLTVSGGEPGANKDGSIPAFAGTEAPAAGWTWGKKRIDAWKHKDEKPLYSIDAGNVDKYADKLSPGQVALVKQTKGYRMDVYPSHRTCGVPDFVAENTKKNVAVGKLKDNGGRCKKRNCRDFHFRFRRTVRRPCGTPRCAIADWLSTTRT